VVRSAGGGQRVSEDQDSAPAAVAAAVAASSVGGDMSLNGAACSRCRRGFSKDEEIVNSGGEIWHTQCFV